jgi:hypothetical protein
LQISLCITNLFIKNYWHGFTYISGCFENSCLSTTSINQNDRTF